MAGAMLSRWLDTGVSSNRFVIVRPSGSPVRDLHVLTAPPSGHAGILLLGMKPQQVAQAAADWQSASQDAIVVSILAGVRHQRIAQLFPRTKAVVRAMPNLPVAIGKGVVALHGPREVSVEQLMQPLGLVEWIDDEALFDAVTALAGSGPAFVYRFIDALAKGAGRLGLGPDQALRLAIATVEGAGALGAAASEEPGALADRVASKGGSTRAGLDVLDDGAALERLVAATLAAAEARNRKLAN